MELNCKPHKKEKASLIEKIVMKTQWVKSFKLIETNLMKNLN